MQARREIAFSEAEYLLLDAESDERLEYLGGRVVAMAGEEPDHAAVKDLTRDALRTARPDCLVRTAGLRVRAPGYGRHDYAYPDVVMVCGEPGYDQGTRPPTLLNPTLLVEVTSASTAERDYSEKLQAYFQVESLQEYWIVDPARPRIVQHQRVPEQGGVLLTTIIADLEAVVASERLGVRIALRSLYAETSWYAGL